MNERFYRLRALFRKEIIQLFKNPKTRLTLFLPPILQLLVLGYAATMDLTHVDFAVLDHANDPASRGLIAKFTGSSVFFRSGDLLSEKDMADKISRREIKMALVIPENFSRALAGQSDPVIQVIVDGRNSSTAGLIQGYAANVIEQFNRDRLGGKAPFTIQTRAWFNPNYSAQYYMVPSLLATIALLDLMLLTALALAKEREEGTFDQLLLTPYTPGELLFVKGASSFFVGTCQLSAGLVFILFWFHIPFMGSFFLLYALFAAFMFASIGIGLLMSVLCNDLNQAMMATFLVAIPFATLSGMATPIDSMPDFFQKITLINPIRYGVASLQRIFLEGATFSQLLPTFAILAVIGTGGIIAANLAFMWQRRS